MKNNLQGVFTDCQKTAHNKTATLKLEKILNLANKYLCLLMFISIGISCGRKTHSIKHNRKNCDAESNCKNPKSIPNPTKTFLEYCEDKNAKDDTKHTVSVLMSKIDKETCEEAERALNPPYS